MKFTHITMRPIICKLMTKMSLLDRPATPDEIVKIVQAVLAEAEGRKAEPLAPRLVVPEDPDEESAKQALFTVMRPFVLQSHLKDRLAINGQEPICLMSRLLANGDLVAGYLVQDECCPYPLEDRDDLGRILSFSGDHGINPAEGMRILGSDRMAVGLTCDSDEIWDLAEDGIDGVWVPGDCCRPEVSSRSRRQHISYQEAARELAKRACREHNEWVCGECYIWIITRFDPEGNEIGSDSCCGCVGLINAQQVLRYEFDVACADSREDWLAHCT